jgi:hypothetical protein
VYLLGRLITWDRSGPCLKVYNWKKKVDACVLTSIIIERLGNNSHQKYRMENLVCIPKNAVIVTLNTSTTVGTNSVDNLLLPEARLVTHVGHSSLQCCTDTSRYSTSTRDGGAIIIILLALAWMESRTLEDPRDVFGI